MQIDIKIYTDKFDLDKKFQVDLEYIPDNLTLNILERATLYGLMKQIIDKIPSVETKN